MPGSVFDGNVLQVFESARAPKVKRLRVGDTGVDVVSPFRSPEDWRDQWIYGSSVKTVGELRLG
jgi:hypothetical protein